MVHAIPLYFRILNVWATSLPQFGAGLESDHATRSNFTWLASSGVAPKSGVFVAQREIPKARQFYRFTRSQRFTKH
ncbi:hypothetical protein ANFP_24630 [Acidithiobacillus ferrooxidans]|nr:hypothetical protein ANFP_24630 [Acidithiobacillus ferrooxidans]